MTIKTTNLSIISTLKSLAGVLLAALGASHVLPGQTTDWVAVGSGALVVAAYVVADAIAGKTPTPAGAISALSTTLDTIDRPNMGTAQKG